MDANDPTLQIYRIGNGYGIKELTESQGLLMDFLIVLSGDRIYIFFVVGVVTGLMDWGNISTLSDRIYSSIKDVFICIYQK